MEIRALLTVRSWRNLEELDQGLALGEAAVRTAGEEKTQTCRRGAVVSLQLEQARSQDVEEASSESLSHQNCCSHRAVD